MSNPRVLLFVGASLILSGCVGVFPKTAALEDVQRAYRTEFTQHVGAVSGLDVCRSNSTDDGFPETRAEIANFRSSYGADGTAGAHLSVLEGMIYLQSAQFGLARANQDDVTAAAAKLSSGTGFKTRDALFAESYGSLLSGWEATCHGDANALDDAALRAAAAALDTASDEIEAMLSKYWGKGKLAAQEVDNGAIYLWATALRFRQNQIVFTKDAECATVACDTDAVKAAEGDLEQTVCKMQLVLTEDERSGLALERLNPGSLTGRLRFVAIYQDARKEVGTPNCPAPQ